MSSANPHLIQYPPHISSHSSLLTSSASIILAMLIHHGIQLCTLLLSTLAQAAILAGSSSTDNADGNGEQQTNDVRNTKKSQRNKFDLISLGLRALKEEDVKSLPTRETINTESPTTFAPSISHKTLVPSPSSVAASMLTTLRIGPWISCSRVGAR